MSAQVIASNDISIDAASLTVSGGQADGNTAFGGTMIVDANATLQAGRDITLTLATNLSVLGGTASGTGANPSASVHVKANASVAAGRDISVNNVGVMSL